MLLERHMNQLIINLIRYNSVAQSLTFTLATYRYFKFTNIRPTTYQDR